MMPVMSGDQLLRELRDDPSFDLVPFLALTAKADQTLRVRMLREGAQEFLVKPFSPAELVTRAENLVAVRLARTAAQSKLEERSRAADLLSHDLAAQREQLVQGFEKLRRSESLLRVALAEKEVLLREIHHRVKNNLQVVASLLHLHVSEAPDSPAASTLERCAGRVRAMALLHESLYRHAQFARIDLGGYLSDVVNSVRASYSALEGVRLELHADEVLVDPETALPCGLILHELVVNSYRHAFPDGVGTVSVRLERSSDGRARLEVRDDGRGLPPGIRLDSTETLGLQLVSSLAEQAGARLERLEGRGTVFQLELAA
jgi:two-component sensor histidine kinase